MATPSWKRMKSDFNTHKSVLITNVVRQLQLVERDDFLHPLFARRRWVGVDVHSLGHLRIRLARHHPSTANQKQLSAYFTRWLCAGTLTCCGICTGNRPPRQCRAAKCTWTYCLNLIRGTSSAGTFDCKDTKNINQWRRLTFPTAGRLCCKSLWQNAMIYGSRSQIICVAFRVITHRVTFS